MSFLPFQLSQLEGFISWNHIETIYTIATKKAAHFKKVNMKKGNHSAEVNLLDTQDVAWRLLILNTLEKIHMAQKNKKDPISTYNKFVTALFNLSGFHILIINWIPE